MTNTLATLRAIGQVAPTPPDHLPAPAAMWTPRAKRCDKHPISQATPKHMALGAVLNGTQRAFVEHPRRNAGLLHGCTRGSQHKAQKEIWLVSGLQDHRYLWVTRVRREYACEQSTEQAKSGGVAAVRS